MAAQATRLSIVIRTVDNATAKIKAINDRLDAATKPMRNFREALSGLREKSGLDGVISGFKGVGGAITDLLGKVAMIGGVAGVAVAGLFKLVDGFDELGDKAEAIGVGVDYLAQMRYAAELSGASIEQLDSGLQGFSKSLGQARAGTGRMASFLGKVSPALLKQLKGAKSNEQAFDLLADAMVKLKDPAKKAALAQATLGDAALAPLFAKGAGEIKKLRDEHLANAGSMKEAAEKAGQVDDSMKKLKAATDGVKAALVAGLAPALKDVVERLSAWFSTNRERIAAWAKDVGEKLPGAIRAVVEWLGKAFDKVRSFVDAIGGLGNAAIGLGLILAGPLISSVVGLGGAMLKMVGTVGSMSGAFASAGAGATGFGAKAMAMLGPIGLAIAAAAALNEITGGSIGVGRGGAMGLAQDALDIRAGRTKAGADAVRDTAMSAFNAARGDVSGQARALRPAAAESSAKITVDFGNAPPGLRVTTDPKSTAGVDTNLGFRAGAR
jgi:hypothetical protein